jgi:hypothetical protein
MLLGVFVVVAATVFIRMLYLTYSLPLLLALMHKEYVRTSELGQVMTKYGEKNFVSLL